MRRRPTPRALVCSALLLLSGACSRDAATPSGGAPEATATVAPGPRAIPSTLPGPVEMPAEPGEAGVRDFVTTFMDLRLMGDGDRARDFLSPAALQQYAAPRDILPLTSMSFTGWDLLALNAADASSWEARVRIRREDDHSEELLFVGPGPDAGGTQRTWIIRGVALP